VGAEEMVLEGKVLVAGHILGTLTRERHPWLSSKTTERPRLLPMDGRVSLSASSCRRTRIGRSSRIAMLNATYSAAVELRVTSAWSLLDQITGQP
jgi:hypothetical protein